MAVQFYKLKVKKLKKETPEATSIVFEAPKELKEVFKYSPGQYITIKVPGPETDNRRAYSICSSPYMNEELTVAVKKSSNGRVSDYINDNLKEGEELEVMPPLGNFIYKKSENDNKHYLLVGAGSGITPLMSILKAALHTEPSSKVTLLYGNRNEDSIIFKEDIEKIRDMFGGRFQVVHILSQASETWTGLRGRIDKERFKMFFNRFIDPKDNYEVFLCGPEGMMNSVEEALEGLNVPKEKIHKESFTASLSFSNPENKEEASDVDSKVRNIKIRLYGDEHNVDVEPDDTILIAGVKEHLDPPFSCQIGACATCRAMLVSGKVKMDSRDALTDGEIKEGYILTCQAHPLTDDVFVDYDY